MGMACFLVSGIRLAWDTGVSFDKYKIRCVDGQNAFNVLNNLKAIHSNGIHDIWLQDYT